MFKKLILDGQIPYLMTLKKILFWAGLIVPLYIFLEPRIFRDFGNTGWSLLIAVLLVRPLAEIFADLGILRSLCLFRKEVGIFSALLLIGHFVGFLMLSEISIWDGLFDPKYWQSAACGWGLIGLVFAIPVLLSSNKFSMIHLKKNWKHVQHLTYLFFIFGGIHVALIGREGFAAIGLVAIVWLLARVGFKLKLSELNKS